MRRSLRDLDLVRSQEADVRCGRLSVPFPSAGHDVGPHAHRGLLELSMPGNERQFHSRGRRLVYQASPSCHFNDESLTPIVLPFYRAAPERGAVAGTSLGHLVEGTRYPQR